MENSILIWDAIAQMRELTGKEEPFSMVFMSYDRTRGKSEGVVQVKRAKLRPGTRSDQNANAELMLNYLDMDKNLPRQMFQILLMEFNGKRIYVE